MKNSVSTTILETINNLLYSYLSNAYKQNEIVSIINEINTFSKNPIVLNKNDISKTYDELETCLSRINEKQSTRKEKGVYYTDNDITEFIVNECMIHYEMLFFLSATVFDPSCGSGEFLLTALKNKVIINNDECKKKSIKEIFTTIFGNDLNEESIFITKLRLFLFALKETSLKEVKGLGKILNKNFTCEDFLAYNSKNKFDIIIGNPPYVEDKKNSKYGNIYADVLSNVCELSKEEGVIGFIIPLSYVSTPRMSKLRDKLNSTYNTQYIYNYADRPGCLFSQVHQKLTIIIGRKTDHKCLTTGNYQYWYNENRELLFTSQSNVINPYAQKDFIPKLGTNEDLKVYEKIIKEKQSIKDFILDAKKEENKKEPYICLNMRAAFWIKAFLKEHSGNEYQKIYCKNEDERNYLYCLLNSSLFWWFWICISDSWHITNKEFKNFRFPIKFDCKIVKNLAENLENKLEKTKEYVGTKQVDYVYKHKNCLEEIHAIDDYINNLFCLSKKENEYIKNYALIYRTSGGNQN